MIWTPNYLQNAINLSVEIEKQSDPDKVLKRLSQLDKSIVDLEKKFEKKEFTKRELSACKRILDKNKEAIDNIKKDETMQRIAKLFKLIKENTPTPETGTPISRSPKVEPFLNLIFFCDIDVRDHNSAISGEICQALKDEVPFVASKALLSGSGLDENVANPRESIKRDVLQNYDKWNIYQKGDLVVFIPKTYPFKASELGMDFSNNGKVHDIVNIFDGPTRRNSVDDFKELFIKGNQVKKRIYLSGHGEVGLIGGLKVDHYQQLLEFLEKSGCQSLAIGSCLGGSINVLKHYFKILERSEEEEVLPSKNKMPTFPVMIQSIGSFATSENISYADYFNKLGTLLNAKEGYTVTDFSKITPVMSELASFPQVKLPHHANSPGGFRPLVQSSNSQAVSYVDLRAAEVAKDDKIEIKDKKYIELLPSRISTPLQITMTENFTTQSYKFLENDSMKTINIGKGAAILLSMIPGNAHHLIDQINSTEFTLLELFLNNMEVYKESFADKTFFIGELKTSVKNKETGKTEQQSYSKVVLDFSENAMNLYYAEGEPEVYHRRQFRVDTKILIDHIISKTEMAFAVFEAVTHSKPNSEALRTSTGGQEDDTRFESSVRDVFWKNKELPADFEAYLKYRKKEINAMELCKSLSPSSHGSMLERAVNDNDTVLATLLFNLDVNMSDDRRRLLVNHSDFSCRSLIVTAINNNNIDLIKLLIKWTNLNITSLRDGYTPLMAAIEKDSLEMVNLLLGEKKEINFNINYLLRACKNTEIYHAIYNAMASLNLPVKDYINKVSGGNTTFSIAAAEDNKNMIDELMKLGADPYAGNPSPLGVAILRQNTELVKYLLEKGLDPTKEVLAGKSGLEYACERGTPEITALLMSKANMADLPKPSNLWIKAKERPAILTMLLKQDMALFEKDRQSLWILGHHALISKNIAFLNKLMYIDPMLSDKVIRDIIKRNDIDTMRSLLKSGYRIGLNELAAEMYEQNKFDFFELLLEFVPDPSTVFFKMSANDKEHIKMCWKVILDNALHDGYGIEDGLLKHMLSKLPVEIKTQYLNDLINQDYMKQALSNRKKLYDILVAQGVKPCRHVG
jgi:ankyrin repeat protein